MPLVAADLLSPKGMISPTMFPGTDARALDARVAAYLADGYDKAATVEAGVRQDQAARAWAYHRACEDTFVRLSAEPAALDVEAKGGHTYSVKQIEHFRTLSETYLSRFYEAVSTTSEAEASPFATGHAPTRIIMS